ncbi:MAG TPA: APC family permease [Sphingomicrobium sp.]|nr:APC family permease [Sphingomicrobium sp.]
MNATAAVPAERPAPHLLKLLGVVFGLAVGIGTIIGGGILRTPGAVAAEIPSFWWIIGLWLFGAVHAWLGANLSAELFTSVPKAGGMYVPVRRAFGDLPAMVVGWSDVLNNSAALAALAIAGAEFLALASPSAAGWKLTLAILLILVLLAINALGLREGRAAQVATTALKVGLLMAIVAAAISLPAVPVSTLVNAAPAIGVAGMIAAYQLVYGAYTGWITPVYFVEEDVAPGRNLPRSLMLSVLAVGAVYVALNLALLHSIPIAELGKLDIPVGDLLGRLFGQLGTVILGITGFVIILGCCNGVIMMTSRIIYGLARDGLFPHHGMRVNRGGTPWVGLLFAGIAAVAMTTTGSFEAAFRLMGALAVVGFVVVDLSIFALRRREPHLARPFAAIGYPLLPALTLLLDIGLTVAIIWYDPTSGLITLGLLAAALPVWFLTAPFRRRVTST